MDFVLILFLFSSYRNDGAAMQPIYGFKDKQACEAAGKLAVNSVFEARERYRVISTCLPLSENNKKSGLKL